MSRVRARERVKPTKAAGWANRVDAVLAPSPETIAIVEKRKKPRCAVPTTEGLASRRRSERG
jgi:hypothetical protein